MWINRKGGLRWVLNGWNIAYGDGFQRVPPLRDASHRFGRDDGKAVGYFKMYRSRLPRCLQAQRILLAMTCFRLLAKLLRYRQFVSPLWVCFSKLRCNCIERYLGIKGLVTLYLIRIIPQNRSQLSFDELLAETYNHKRFF